MDLKDITFIASTAYNALRQSGVIPDSSYDHVMENWSNIVYYHNKTIKFNVYRNTTIGIRMNNDQPLVHVTFFDEPHKERPVTNEFFTAIVNINDESYNKNGTVPFIALSFETNQLMIFLPYNFYPIKSIKDI